jgi:hypothetical protein
MKTSRTLVALTAVNLALLLLAVAQQLRPAFAQGEPAVLRGRGLEIVDAQGRVRASISVLPPIKSANGDEQAETVLLRLITERGRAKPRCRLSRNSIQVVDLGDGFQAGCSMATLFMPSFAARRSKMRGATS